MLENTTSTAIMEERYRRAQNLMQGVWSNSMAFNTTIFPVWIKNSDCFWYERTIKQGVLSEQGEDTIPTFGKEYRLVDANLGSNEAAFNHQVVAEALAQEIGQKIEANNLPIHDMEMIVDQQPSSSISVKVLRFMAFDRRWQFDLALNTLTSLEPLATGVISPNGKSVVFERDCNLWVKNIETGDEKPLTSDGEENYVYGGVGTAWGMPASMDNTVQVRWSPDAKRIFTVQRDTRKVLTLPIVHHIPDDGGLRPVVEYTKVAYPGDEYVETLRLLVIDVETGHIQEALYPNIPVTRNSDGFFTAKLGWWSVDSRHAYFVDMARDYKTVRVIELDAYTGKTRVLFEETSDTHINLMLNQDELPLLVPLPETGELLWFSERSGWAHLYLYDLNTGQLKNTITQGEWLVRGIVQIDMPRREIFIQTAGRLDSECLEIRSGSPAAEKIERDPYYRDLARVNLDTGEINTIVAGDHEYITFTSTDQSCMISGGVLGYDTSHSCGISPSGNFAVVTRSRADEIPVSILLDRNGGEIATLETADISALMSLTNNAWQWPEPVKLLAADDMTDIYGLVFRPSDFSPKKSYPVISHVLNVPEAGWVPKGSFSNGSNFGLSYLDAAALAELGFIVVQIDGRGATLREKSFFDECYGWLESCSNLDDHVAGIKQLAERYPYMDLERVGITNTHGGPGGVQGLLQYPGFYTVGVSFCLHDSRLVGATMWGEKFEGKRGSKEALSDEQPKRHSYPENHVHKLQGKLLLMHGMLDAAIPPAATFRLMAALQNANKDFDSLIMPTVGHVTTSYFVRRTWDYFVTHLLDVNPPKEFDLKTMYG